MRLQSHLIKQTNLHDGSVLYTFGDAPPAAAESPVHHNSTSSLPDKDTLMAMKLTDLRALAKERNTRGIAKLRKEELIDVLLSTTK